MMHNLQNKLGVNGLKKQIRSKMKKKMISTASSEFL